MVGGEGGQGPRPDRFGFRLFRLALGRVGGGAGLVHGPWFPGPYGPWPLGSRPIFARQKHDIRGNIMSAARKICRLRGK